jgi:fused signal recognition particle receptor
VAGFLGRDGLSQEFWQELESALVRADVGVSHVLPLIRDLREQQAEEGWKSSHEAIAATRKEIRKKLIVAPEPRPVDYPHVILLLGVNGSGKTTSAARLAKRWLDKGCSVLLAAADTFRAAASDQLETWAQRLEIECMVGTPGSDPGAVVFNAVQSAVSSSTEVVIVDTSGRMHTSHNLMAELAKIHRVAGKTLESAPQEVLLVLDATTGQNGLAQARGFFEAVPTDGVILAKLDSSARGGIALPLCIELGLPLRYAGIGESIDDLVPFDPDAYVQALLADVEEERED